MLAWILVDETGRTIAGHGTELTVQGVRLAASPDAGSGPVSAVADAWVSVLDLARAARADRPGRDQAVVSGSEHATWLHRTLPSSWDRAPGIDREARPTLTVLTRGFTASEAAAAERALAASLAGELPADDDHRGDPVELPRVAVHALAENGRVIAAHRSAEGFAAASTIKVAVAVAILAAVDEGALGLDATITARSRFPARDEPGIQFALTAEESDPTFPPAGTPVTIRECLARMIERSSNEATNVLAELIGLDAIAERVGALGLDGTRMDRLIGDYRARERGLGHETTASDLAQLLAAILDGRALASQSTRVLLDLLRAQRYPAITQGLAHATDAGSKSGWDDGIRNDVAWFVPSRQLDARIILAIGVEGMESRAAIETIRAIARAVEVATEIEVERHLPRAISG